MNRVPFFGLIFLGFIFQVSANEVATSFMLMNNYDIRNKALLWDRMVAGFKLNQQETKLVSYYEQQYTKNPRAFIKIIKRAQPYLYFILTELERNNMPSELALLPIVESSYDPYAMTRANSAGLWQFMSFTGNRFNLLQNDSLDERQDIVKSSKAAIRYCLYLFRLFKQWDVAIGAYNWGEGNMYKSVRNSGQTLGQVDYSSLNLRPVTQVYVPKLIALANIIRNPKRFGIELEPYPNQPFFAIVKSATIVKTDAVISQAKVDVAIFAKLNPQFKNINYQLSVQNKFLLPLINQNIYYAANAVNYPMNVITPSNPNYSQLTELNNNVEAKIDSEPLQTSLTDNDDALMQLVNKDTGENNLINNNDNIVNNSELQNRPISNKEAEKELNDLINKLAQEDKSSITDALSKFDTARTDINYQVKEGETLYSISKKFNVDINQLRQQNDIPGDNITDGQILLIKGN